VLKFGKPAAKLGIVAAGYVVALAIAALVTSVYVASTSGPDRQTYGGMYAFGDSVLFLGVFGVAAIPATALTQSNGDPAVWMVKHAGKDPVGTVDLMPVAVHGYRNDLALVSGVPNGGQVVTAGVQKMAPGLKVLLPSAALAEASLTQIHTTQQAVR